MILDFNREITLEDDYVRIEPLRKSHLQELYPIAISYPDLLKYSPSPFGDRTNLKVYIETALTGKKEKNRYPFIIFDKRHNKYIGSTSLGDVSNKDLRLQIGWTWLEKESQGTGLNKHCKFLLLNFAFNKLNFERVEFKTDSRNAQSRRAIEKIGATYEGELRSHTLMLDGYRRNTVCYSILKGEWPLIQVTAFKEFLL